MSENNTASKLELPELQLVETDQPRTNEEKLRELLDKCQVILDKIQTRKNKKVQ
jgi:hypothetical protein